VKATPHGHLNGKRPRLADDGVQDLSASLTHQLERIKRRGKIATASKAQESTSPATPNLNPEFPMHTTTDNETVHTLDIRKDILIAASPEVAFAAVLEELGPGSQMPDGKPFLMKIEPWPGGRWYRDLGETGGHKYGHLWGTCRS
jgi:hypothetical protein